MTSHRITAVLNENVFFILGVEIKLLCLEIVTISYYISPVILLCLYTQNSTHFHNSYIVC